LKIKEQETRLTLHEHDDDEEYLDSHMKQRQFPAVFIIALGPQERFPPCLCLPPSPLPPKLEFYHDIKTCEVQGYHKQSILQFSRMIYQVGWQTSTEVSMKFSCTLKMERSDASEKLTRVSRTTCQTATFNNSSTSAQIIKFRIFILGTFLFLNILLRLQNDLWRFVKVNSEILINVAGAV
jgi:hypothetical protein